MRRRRRPTRRGDRTDDRPVRALLDFGASGARAALVRVGRAGAELLGAAEVRGRSGMARPGQVMHRERIATLAERALSAAEWSTARDGALPEIADEAIVGVTGPLLKARGEIHHRRRRDPIAPIYEPEILETLEMAQRRALDGLSQTLAENRIRRRLIASQLVGAMSLREDTRRAERLPDVSRGIPGHAGDFLSIALCNLTWPAKGLEIMTRVLDDLELALHDVTPIAQAVAAAIPLPDAILIDIGREHSEIALAEGGAISDLSGINLGGSFFTDYLTRNLRLSGRQAELLKQRIEPSELEAPVARLLGRATIEWQREIEQALLGMAGDAPLPPRIYLYGGGANLPLLLPILRAQPWAQRLPFERYPVVELLVPQQLRGLYDPRGVLHGPAQVGLAALATWAARDPSPLQRHLETVTAGLESALGLV